MAQYYVGLALSRAMRLYADINRESSITALDKFKQKDPKKAAEFELRLWDAVVQIQLAPREDQKNALSPKKSDLRALQKYQVLFVTALRKLDRRASVVNLFELSR